MADTDKLLKALESGAKRIKLSDGTETEFHSPAENIKAIEKIQSTNAVAGKSRRRITLLTYKSGY